MDDFELYHHGVKGMKWGVRRTKAQLGYKVSRGLKKAGKSLSETMKKQKAKRAAKVAKSKPKRVEDMTDEELSTAIRRLEMEKRFKDLSPKKVSKGETFVKSIVNNMVMPAAEDVGKQLIKSAMVDAANKGFNLNDELKIYTNNKKK